MVTREVPQGDGVSYDFTIKQKDGTPVPGGVAAWTFAYFWRRDNDTGPKLVDKTTAGGPTEIEYLGIIDTFDVVRAHVVASDTTGLEVGRCYQAWFSATPPGASPTTAHVQNIQLIPGSV